MSITAARLRHQLSNPLANTLSSVSRAMPNLASFVPRLLLLPAIINPPLPMASDVALSKTLFDDAKVP